METGPSRFFLAHTTLPSGKTIPIRITLTITRYPWWSVPMALLSMVLFRIPLRKRKDVRFFKLMGTGSDGHFSLKADWRRWAILVVQEGTGVPSHPTEAFHETLYGKFLDRWWKACGANSSSCVMEPLSGHGSWDGVAFGPWCTGAPATGRLAVLTRATLHRGRLSRFHGHAGLFGPIMKTMPGNLFSLGIGETPFTRQGTFSLWKDLDSMTAFAYGNAGHREAIRLTRKEGWYREELFLRARILEVAGPFPGLDGFIPPHT